MSAAAVCEWYTACTNDAAGTVRHPVLGDVPTCERCADRHGLELERWNPSRRAPRVHTPDAEPSVALSPREAEWILALIAGEYHRVRVSKAKHWRPSTRAMTLADLTRLFDKVRAAYPKQEVES